MITKGKRRMAYPRIVSRKEALELILDSVHPLATIKLPLEGSLGYIAAEDLYAPTDLPRFNRSAMDGYAICSKDTANATNKRSVKLKVVGEIHPSTAELIPIESGQAVRIMTGGPIPPGADAVVKEEDARCEAGTLDVAGLVPASQHVWEKGKDIKKGSLLVEQGSPVTPAILGILANLQIREVTVTRRPEVCILAVGNELIDLHDKPTGHKIVASNIYMLSAMVKQHGGRLRFAKISKNDKGAIRRDIKEGLKGDMLIMTGGSSNAHSDLTRALMGEMGVELRFAGVSMRPGKGTTFGLYDNKLLFGLPGTPTAVYVVFYTLVLPALLRLMGMAVQGPCCIEAVLEQDINKTPGIEHLVQGFVMEDSHYRVLPLVGPDIEVFPAMARANGLIIVGPDQAHLKQGQTVSVQLLSSCISPL